MLLLAWSTLARCDWLSFVMPNYEISALDLDRWLISLRITSVSQLRLGYLSFWNKCQGSGNNLKITNKKLI